MAIAYCPRCGTRREPGMGFCTRCGMNLARVDAALAAPAPETAPTGSFTPLPAPPPPAGRRREVSLRAFALVGGALGVVGAVLPWVRFHLDRSAFAFPAKYLFTGQSGGRSISVGVVLVALAGAGLLLSPFSAASRPRRILGALVLAVPVAFALQGLGHADASQVFSALGPGAYVSAAGGVLLLFG